ncbi:MAG: metal ABC transporter substrate-binding protein [Cellulosilyticaceae bacterium]
MKKKKKVIIILGVMAYLLFIIIKRIELVREQAVISDTKVHTIVTSFYPMYIHTKALTKGIDIEVVNMASSEVGCLHDYQMTVEDMRKIQQGDVLVMNGLGAENFQAKAIMQNPHLKLVDASTLWLASHGEEASGEDHQEDESGHGHDHAHDNEHLWVSVEGSMMQVKAISQGLQQYDPEHAALYRRNEADYLAQLEALRGQMAQELGSLRGQSIVAVHETFAYLAESLGLEVVATIAAGEQSSLTAKEMKSLSELIANQPRPMIFTEPQYSHFAPIKTLAKESGAVIYELDSMVTSMEGLEGKEPEYIERMKANIRVLKEAYGI